MKAILDDAMNRLLYHVDHIDFNKVGFRDELEQILTAHLWKYDELVKHHKEHHDKEDKLTAHEGEYGYLADEIERRILAMFDNEEPHQFYDDTVLPFIREQLGSKKAVRFKKQPLPAPPKDERFFQHEHDASIRLRKVGDE